MEQLLGDLGRRDRRTSFAQSGRLPHASDGRLGSLSTELVTPPAFEKGPECRRRRARLLGLSLVRRCKVPRQVD